VLRQNVSPVKLLQAAWVVIALGYAIFYLFSIPPMILSFIDDAERIYSKGLAMIGVTAQGYAVFFTLVNFTLPLTACSVGAFLFWRRRDDPMVLLVSLTMVTYSFMLGRGAIAFTVTYPEQWGLVGLLRFACASMVLVVLSIFPNGRFVPRWSPVFIIAAMAILRLTGDSRSYITININPQTALAIVFFAVGLAFQVYRFRRHSSLVERQQTKWVVFGMSVAIVSLTVLAVLDLFVLPLFIDNPLVRVLYRMISNPLLLFLPCSFVPVAVGLAITRNRLWDIDLIINRSLVVIIAATLLAILFLIVVLVIQAVFHSTLYGLPFVGAAVLSGALFDPTRRRVQHVLDRRFYRWRFDLIQLANAERDKTTARVGRWTGKILDGYQIEGVIGSGGMGEVYRATKDNRTYAIKTVLEDAPADGMDRLRREIVAIKPMQHPNIVQFYEAGLSPAPYIVLEFIDGVNLRALLQSRGRLSPEDALVILRGLADGLDYAHDRGVIHRDLKPSNIVLRMAHEGNTIVPLLIDFGLARVSSGSTVTGTGAIGTISYMAPEQIESGKTITRQTDVYSLGVILYEMLTGQLPFGGFPAQIMFAHLQQPPPDPRLIVPELPETFALAIQKAMAKEKAERWQSAGEMIAALAGEREAAVIG
jgi:hypothetical protein